MFKGGMAGMMQKAKQMQDEMRIAKEEIQQLSCEGIAESGDLKIIMNGEYKVTEINIKDSLMTDKELLEDLIMLAVNNASTKVKELSNEKMKNITGGLNLPF